MVTTFTIHALVGFVASAHSAGCEQPSQFDEKNPTMFTFFHVVFYLQ
jgi:hypothetical protein